MKQLLRLKRSVLCQNSLIMLVAGFLAGVLGYLFHALVSRSLSVAQYGELQSLISVLTIFTVLANALSYLGVKYGAVLASKGDIYSCWHFLRRLRHRVWQLAVWLFFVYVLASPMLRIYLNFDDMLGLMVVGIAGLFTILTISDLGVLTGWEFFGQISIVNVTGAAVKLVAGVTLASLAPKASVVIGSGLLASLAVLWLLRWFSGKKFNGARTHKVNSSEWRDKYFAGVSIRKRSVPIVIYSLLIALISTVDIIIVRHLLSPDITGYYGALSVLGRIVLWGNLVVITVVLPGAVAKGHVGERVGQRVLYGAYGLILGISLMVITVYYLFPSYIVRLFFGDRYVQYSGVLWLFGVVALVLTLLQLEANFAFARSDWRVLYLLMLVVVLMIISIYLFRESIQGVVLGVMASLMVGYVSVWGLNNLFSLKLRTLV